MRVQLIDLYPTHTQWLTYSPSLPLISSTSQGTHDELMALPDGGYKRLVAAQMGGSAAAKSRVQSKANLAGQDRSSPTK